LEAALIIHALADLSSRLYARALALATTCIFIKPTMAYVLGLVIVILMIMHFRRQRTWGMAVVRQFIPATLVGLVCLISIVCYFGFTPLKNTLLPLTGRRSYEALDFGFFGNGRSFWLPETGTASAYVQHYLFTPAGFWLTCTILLGVCGIFSVRKLLQESSAWHETLLAIAVCHFFFIFVLFAWPGSWTYYSYLLVIGAGIGATIHGFRPIWIGLLILLAVLGHAQRYQYTVNAWKWSERTPETAGLWAHRDEREEWRRVRAIAERSEVFFLNNGCAELLFPRRARAGQFLSLARRANAEGDRSHPATT
jgi:hypothetical protein